MSYHRSWEYVTAREDIKSLDRTNPQNTKNRVIHDMHKWICMKYGQIVFAVKVHRFCVIFH